MAEHGNDRGLSRLWRKGRPEDDGADLQQLPSPADPPPPTAWPIEPADPPQWMTVGQPAEEKLSAADLAPAWMNAETDPRGDNPGTVTTQDIPAVRRPDRWAHTGTDHAGGPCATCNGSGVCPTCRGAGTVPTVNDVIREMLGLLPTDAATLDGFIVAGYQRVVAADEKKRPADKLGPLFPPDLISAVFGNPLSKGFRQREKLLTGLTTALRGYDPDGWEHDPGARQRHDRFLAKAGNSHREFRYPDGTVRDGARPNEYLFIGEVVHDLLAETIGEEWRPEYGPAYWAGYWYAMVEMLYAQQHPAEDAEAGR